MNNHKAGFSMDEKTFLVGQEGQPVKRIFVDGSNQFAKNDFGLALNRFGVVNEISSHDVQNTIMNGGLAAAIQR